MYYYNMYLYNNFCCISLLQKGVDLNTVNNEFIGKFLYNLHDIQEQLNLSNAPLVEPLVEEEEEEELLVEEEDADASLVKPLVEEAPMDAAAAPVVVGGYSRKNKRRNKMSRIRKLYTNSKKMLKKIRKTRKK